MTESVTAEQFDPDWWRSALFEDDGTPSHWKTPERRSTRLLRQAEEAEGADPVSLRARTLRALAMVASPMSKPERWNAPFHPMMTWTDGGRTALPEDLDSDQLALLAEVAPLIERSTFKARVADIAWWYGDRGNTELLDLAVATYLETPLDRDTWYESGSDNFRRALEILVRRGDHGRPLLGSLAARVVEAITIDDAPAADSFFLVHLSTFAQLFRRGISEASARAMARRLVEHAKGVAVENPRLSRAYERQACHWLQALDEQQAAHECLVRVAGRYIAEADARSSEAGGALVADRFIEGAIKTLRSLPPSYRRKNGIEEQLISLAHRLAETHEAAVEQMARISTDPIDITDAIAHSRNEIAGRTAMEALTRLATILPLPSAEKAIEDARESLTGSIRGLIGSATFTRDGRKTATSQSHQDDFEQRVLEEAIRTFSMTAGFMAEAAIGPALEQFNIEHRIRINDLYQLCLDAPIIPAGHEFMWSKGLQYGFDGDPVAAVSILIPQIEQMVRHHLKRSGVITTHSDEHFVQMEKSLNYLLELEEATDMFGANLVFLLKALLCEQTGPNLRNDLAHGLFNDADTTGRVTTYAWWLCLKLLLVDFHARKRAQQVEPATESDPEEDPTPVA